jgi:hypothetical protein
VPAPTLQGVFYNISENSLSQASVDDILSTCAVNASIAINSYLGLDGGYNASPSSVGLSAKALLETYNWTVMVN